MTLYIDPPTWPGHGRLWSHLVSDVSYEELHLFAARLGVPRRAFERDHYDIPEHRYREAVLAGALEVSSREVVRLLHGAGLRRRKGASTGTGRSAVPGLPGLPDGLGLPGSRPGLPGAPGAPGVLGDGGPGLPGLPDGPGVLGDGGPGLPGGPGAPGVLSDGAPGVLAPRPLPGPAMGGPGQRRSS